MPTAVRQDAGVFDTLGKTAMTRLSALVFAAAMAMPSAASAASALETVRGLYVPTIWNPLEEDSLSGVTEPALAVFRKSAASATDGEVGCIDFVVTADGQDYDDAEIAKSLELKDRGEDANGDTEIAARFDLFSEPHEVVWTMREEDGVWKVADIASKTSRWRLSEMTCQ